MDYDLTHLPKHFRGPATPMPLVFPTSIASFITLHTLFRSGIRSMSQSSNTPDLNPFKHLLDVLEHQVISVAAPPHNQQKCC